MAQSRTVNRLIAFFVLLSFMFTASCTTTKVYPVQTERSKEQNQGIKVGDRVKIRTHSGEKYTFKVTNITPEEIEGEGIKLKSSEIESIRTVHISKKAIIFGLVLVAAVLTFIILGSGSGSGSDGAEGYFTTTDGRGK